MSKSNKGKLPDLLFVSPIGQGMYKIRHRHCVFEIVDFAQDGWPLTLRLIREEEVVDVQKPNGTGKCFMTAYCQEDSLSPWKAANRG